MVEVEELFCVDVVIFGLEVYGSGYEGNFVSVIEFGDVDVEVSIWSKLLGCKCLFIMFFVVFFFLFGM